MANWTNLKETIANVIKTNGNQEITGQVLQNTLTNIVNVVGKNATFVDVATPSTNPGVPDGPVFYIATTAGNYSNFGNIEVLKGETAILKWNNGTWTKNAIKPMTDFNSVFDANGNSLTNELSTLHQEVGELEEFLRLGNIIYEGDLSNPKDGYIRSDGKYESSTIYKHYELPSSNAVNATLYPKINHNTGVYAGIIYAFLKNAYFSQGATPNFCDGYEGRIVIESADVTGPIIIDIPKDCEILYVYASSPSEGTGVSKVVLVEPRTNVIDDLSNKIDKKVGDLENALDLQDIEVQRQIILNKENALDGYYRENTTNFIADQTHHSFLFDVYPNTKLTIQNKVGKTHCRVFDAEGKEIKKGGNAYFLNIDNGVFEIPSNAVKFSLTYNTNYFKNAIIVSYNEVVHTNIGLYLANKPRLTDKQKDDILQLVDEYYKVRNNFTYDTTVIRASYKDSGIVTNGKVRICCNAFVQHIVMGRKPTFAVNPSNYTNVIDKAFDGYYFQFPMAKYCAYKTRKPLVGGDTDTNAYFGYTKKAIGSFSFTTREGSSNYAGKQQYLNFSNAADLAYELWNMGLEIGRREAEVGDIIFYKEQVMQNTSLFAETNFREITHVGIIVDTNYKGEGFLRVAHSAFDDGTYIKGDARGTWTEADGVSDQTIFISAVNDEIPYWSCKMGDYERRIAMIARNPMAVITGNVPDSIVE